MKTLTMFCLALGLLLATGVANAAEKKTMTDTLTPRQKAIAVISSHTANGDMEKLAPALEDGLQAGLTVNEIKEVLVQLYAYCGFPRSLNALTTFMQVLEQRQGRGISDKTGPEPAPYPTDRTSLEFGTDNQTRLTGRPVSGALFDFAPAIDHFLKAHLFGDIFQRDNLDWQNREISTIAALGSMTGVESQLQSHYAIGMNNKLTPDHLRGIVSVIREAAGLEAGDRAGAVLESMLKK